MPLHPHSSRSRPARLAAAAVACAAGLFAPGPAAAISFDASGKVVGWNITPFSQANGNTTAGDITSIRQNNYSPLNFPNGIGHIPSPGGATGEKFDLEEMHIRSTGSQVQVLVIASSLYQIQFNNSTLKLGDLLINIDGDAAFELGVVTQSANAGLNAGGLYEITGTAGLQNASGSYAGTAIAAEIGPWAITSGIAEGLHALETASFNFGGSEGVTYAYQYTFDFGFLPSMPSHLDFQLAWGCGNDMIEGGTPIPITPTTVAAIPEPAPLALFLVAGWLGVTVVGRMRRSSRQV